MTGAIRIWAAALVAAFAITRADAADLTPTPEPLPPAPPIFYVHVGALGVFYSPPDAQLTGGGLLKQIPTGLGTVTLNNVAIPPSYTLGLEAGYFITPNIAIALSAGVPPLIHIKATVLNFASALGTDQVGSARYGPLIAPPSIPLHSMVVPFSLISAPARPMWCSSPISPTAFFRISTSIRLILLRCPRRLRLHADGLRLT